MHKRKGETDAAIQSYMSALESEPQAFFPNYNLSVLLASESKYQESIKYFLIS